MKIKIKMIKKKNLNKKKSFIHNIKPVDIFI